MLSYQTKSATRFDKHAYVGRGVRFTVGDRGANSMSFAGSANAAIHANYERGVGYVEYLLTTLVIIAVLFFPIPGQQGVTVFDWVLQALQGFGQTSSFFLSLP